MSEYSRARVTITAVFYGLEEEMLNKGHSLSGSLFRLGYVVISALCMSLLIMHLIFIIRMRRHVVINRGFFLKRLLMETVFLFTAHALKLN